MLIASLTDETCLMLYFKSQSYSHQHLCRCCFRMATGYRSLRPVKGEDTPHVPDSTGSISNVQMRLCVRMGITFVHPFFLGKNPTTKRRMKTILNVVNPIINLLFGDGLWFIVYTIHLWWGWFMFGFTTRNGEAMLKQIAADFQLPWMLGEVNGGHGLRSWPVLVIWLCLQM